jgi:NADH-dependent peroxiredoxin subunit F
MITAQLIYDLIIIGAGPAGITAAVYAARKRMNFLVLTDDIGGQAAWSGDIENYTGYQFISGPELAVKFEEHMRTYNITVHEREAVQAIDKTAEVVSVTTARGIYQARTLIIASGKRTRHLNVPGEVEFKNHGLTYCATCDGPLFADKDVLVVGGGNSALDAVLQMVKIAKHVHLINNAAALGGDAIMRSKVESDSRVSVINGSRVMAITGEKFVTGVSFNDSTGAVQTLEVQGVFVEIGLIPNSEFAGILEKNANLEIKINLSNETNIPGIFAAGDVTDVPEKQIIIAAGEGSKAALSAFRYLAHNSFE